MQHNLETVRVYSCLPENPDEKPHVLVEACLANGGVFSGEMSATDAAALAESLQRAARMVGAVPTSCRKRSYASYSGAPFTVKP